MRILRLGLKGEDILAWQLFLASEDYILGAADGDFGPKTHLATKQFQSHHLLIADGIVGAQTMQTAMGLGFDPFDWPTDTPHAATKDPYWPPLPHGMQYLSLARAENLYGKYKWKMAPTAREPRAIKILDDWEKKNMTVSPIPQLARIGKPVNPNRAIHKLAEKKILALWDAWEKAGLLRLVKTFDGLANFRVIGGTKTLSNHAFGAAFDINEPWNKWGGQPAAVGQVGSVRELVPLANQHGFFWGGHFQGKKDGMHFELVEPN